MNDNVLEMDESFNVSLESIQALNNSDKINRIHITSANAEINIIDDDGGDCTYMYVIHCIKCMYIDRWVGAGTHIHVSTSFIMGHACYPAFVNPPCMRRRVTVLGLCVCVCVCVSVCLIGQFLPFRSIKRPKRDTIRISGLWERFLKRCFDYFKYNTAYFSSFLCGWASSSLFSIR